MYVRFLGVFGQQGFLFIYLDVECIDLLKKFDEISEVCEIEKKKYIDFKNIKMFQKYYYRKVEMKDKEILKRCIYMVF